MLEIATSSRGFAMDATNVSGRAGRWSAAHWKTAAFGWIGVGILAVVVGGAVAARRADPRPRELQHPRPRERARPVSVGDGRRSRVLVRGGERRPDAFGA